MQSIFEKKNNNEIYYNLNLSYDKKYIAFGSLQGDVKVFKTENYNDIKLFSHLKQNYSFKLNDAVLALDYRPYIEDKTSNVVLVSYSNKSLCTYLPSNDKLLNEIKLDTNFLDVKYVKNSDNFIAAGEDGNVYYVNNEDKLIMNKFQPEERKHNNRCIGIYNHENVVLSIGWDSMAIIWDLRDKKLIGKFNCGMPNNKAISFIDNNIILGYLRDLDNLKIFDIRNYKNSKLDYTLKFDDTYGHVRSINLIKDNNFSIFTNNNPFMSIVNLNNGTIGIESQNKLDFNVSSSLFIPKDNIIACCSEDYFKFIKVNL